MDPDDFIDRLFARVGRQKPKPKPNAQDGTLFVTFFAIVGIILLAAWRISQ